MLDLKLDLEKITYKEISYFDQAIVKKKKLCQTQYFVQNRLNNIKIVVQQLFSICV